VGGGLSVALTHPFDPDSLYELMDDGNIRVSKGGEEGIFTNRGVHLSGSIREADPQVCVWVSNVPNPDTQLATSRIAGRDSGQAD
jgi:hypothetical protein